MAARGAGRLYRRRGLRLGRTLGVGLGAAVVFWCIGLFVYTSYIPAPAVLPEQHRTDAIVVLTGGSGRVSEGLALLEQGKAGKLFVSGVYRGSMSPPCSSWRGRSRARSSRVLRSAIPPTTPRQRA